MTEGPNRCGECRWYDNRGYHLGGCHANPPTTNSSGQRIFPPVTSSDYCRMWEDAGGKATDEPLVKNRLEFFDYVQMVALVAALICVGAAVGMVIVS